MRMACILPILFRQEVHLGWLILRYYPEFIQVVLNVCLLSWAGTSPSRASQRCSEPVQLPASVSMRCSCGSPSINFQWNGKRKGEGEVCPNVRTALVVQDGADCSPYCTGGSQTHTVLISEGYYTSR